MAVVWGNSLLSSLLALLLIAIGACALAESSIGQLSVSEIENALQVTIGQRHAIIGSVVQADLAQQCPLVQELNIHKRAIAPEVSGYASQVFEALFPGTPVLGIPGPAVNALLATLYISGPPNLLLALCPPNIDPASLSVMVAFAVGGLLGDTLFHLLPEIFLGEAAPDHARFVLVEPNKNLLLGVAIMVGFVTFVAMDKGLRIATGGEGGHSHKSEPMDDKTTETSSAVVTGSAPVSSNGILKPRKSKSSSEPIISDVKLLKLPPAATQKLWALNEPKRAHGWLEETLEEDAESGVTQIALWKAYESAFHGSQTALIEAKEFIQSASKVFEGASAQVIDGAKPRFIIKGVKPRERGQESREGSRLSTTKPSDAAKEKEASQSIRLSAYLNLIADFTHNITDGLAMSSSFYASPTLGATTAVAVFCHEIPHEVGDFALLIQSGFSKRKAVGAQFVTALGAFLGTCLGIAVQELGKSDSTGGTGDVRSKGLAGTGLGWGDMLLPFTAGTFLYVGTVAVIPELLETGPNKSAELRKTAAQFTAMALGAGIMLAISWS